MPCTSNKNVHFLSPSSRCYVLSDSVDGGRGGEEGNVLAAVARGAHLLESTKDAGEGPRKVLVLNNVCGARRDRTEVEMGC